MWEVAQSGRHGNLHLGEREVRDNARFETHVHFRTGITRVVPWLVLSCLELWDAACGRKVAAMFPSLAEWNGRVK